MALHYQLEDIKVDYKSEDIWPTTQTLIFATMNVGLSSITEENWKEYLEFGGTTIKTKNVP